MVTYSFMGAVVIGAVIVEKRCRTNGNTDGALAARRFGRLFLVGAGGLIAAEWILALIALIG